MKHTPTPWQFVKHANRQAWHVFSQPDKDKMYTSICSTNSLQDAKLIVTAVNNYHALESQVKELRGINDSNARVIAGYAERIVNQDAIVKELREALTETVKFYDRCVENKFLCSVLGKSIFSKAKQLLNKQL